MLVSGSLSHDGWWLWDGSAWIPALSPDGAWRWNGNVWVAVQRPSPRSRWLKLLVVLAIIATTAFGGLFVLDVWLMHLGCGSVDPTDPNNYSVVSIENDTSIKVVVSDCHGAYCNTTKATLPPGDKATVEAECAASGTDMTSVRLSTTGGTTIGYIAVDTPTKHDGLVYPVSHASPTRLLATPPTNRPPRRT